MKRYNFTMDHLTRALILSDEMGEKFKNSIKDPQRSKPLGVLGEIMVLDYLGDKAVHVKDKDYDIMSGSGARVEVKTLKGGSTPQPDYICSVPETSMHQNCDIYVFCRVHKSYYYGWILGWIEVDRFDKESFYAEKGEINRDTEHNKKPFIYSANCYNIMVNQLHQIN